MKVGILKPFTGIYRPMLDIYKQILDYNSIEYIDLDINDADFWNKVKDIDLFLAKISQTDDDLSLASQIMPIITNFLQKPCFPNYPTVWHYDDKVKQFYLLSNYGFPLVESYIFWDRSRAIEWAMNTRYPVVFKLKGGAGSINVKLINNAAHAIRLINKSFGSGIHPFYFDPFGKCKALNYDAKKIFIYYLKPIYRRLFQGLNGFPNYTRHRNYVYFQKFMPDNKYDTRVCILGKRAFAFKRFVRDNDFRASGSNHYDMNRDNIDKRMLKLAFEISNTMGFQSMAYDFVYDEDKQPALIEISYTYGDYPEFSTGYWDEELIWHDGKFVPEYLELVDALNMPELVQPDIELDSPYKKAKIAQ